MARSYPVSEAISVLIARYPFVAVLLINLLEIVETDQLPRAGTDAKRLFINPTWFATLSLDNRVFVLAHEVYHVILLHIQRGKLYKDRGVGPDLRKYNHMKANQAMDYIINRMLCDQKVGRMPMDGLYHPDITANDIWDEVYCKLPDPPEDGSGKGRGGDGKGNSFDDHMDPDPNDTTSPAKVQQAVKAAAAAAKAQGKMPGGMDRLVDEVCEPKIPWSQVLRNTIIAKAGHDEATWRRPNKRRLALPPHIYMPGYTGVRTGPVVLINDTSGSVSNEEQSQYFGEIHGIFQDMPPESCHLMFVDAAVHGVHEITDINDILEVQRQVKGGGGTNLPVAFPKIRELGLEPETVIVFTDGYTDFDEEPEWPVIWVMTSDVVAPYGTTIKMN